MKILNDINRTFRSPAITSGNRVLKWSIWVTAKIRFTSSEVEELQDYNFDDSTSPLVHDLHPGELELINSEFIDDLSEYEISQKVEQLRNELNRKVSEIEEELVQEFDFEIED